MLEYLSIDTWIMLVMYIVRVIVMIINFIGYTVIPELKNSHGLAIRCYIVTYIIIAITYTLIDALIVLEYPQEHLFIVYYLTGITIDHYCNISSALWLQVISFDIWWAFRNMRHVDCRVRRGRNAKFIWYALYAGVLPIILGIPGTICFTMFWMDWNDKLLKKYCSYWDWRMIIETAIYVTVCLCNISFYVSMFCVMRRQKKETAALTEGSNHRHGAQKQWLSLYVKLSLIMGIHVIAWLFIPFSIKIPTLEWIYQVSELLHAILMFRFFIWKDSVKQTLRTRVCSVVSFCSRNINSGDSNTIGSTSPDSEPQKPPSRVQTAF